MSRAISDAWFHRVKAATRDLVKLCGGVIRAGELALVSKTEVSRWQSVADEGIITIPAALALEAECGVPIVTAAMADLGGRRLADPDDTAAPSASIMADHAELVRSAAEVMAAGAAALADGKVTPAEAEIMDRTVSQLERTSMTMRRTLAGLRSTPGLAVVK